MNKNLIYLMLSFVTLVIANNGMAAECTIDEKTEYAKIGITAAKIKEICDARAIEATNQSKNGEDAKIIINNINTNNNTNNNKVTVGATPSSDEDDTMEQFFWNIAFGFSQSRTQGAGDFRNTGMVGFWYFFEQPYRSSVVLGATFQMFSVDDNRATRSMDADGVTGSPTVSNGYFYVGYSFPDVLGSVSLIPFYGVGLGTHVKSSLSNCYSCNEDIDIVVTHYRYNVFGVRFFDVKNASHGSTWYVELQRSMLSYGLTETTISRYDFEDDRKKFSTTYSSQYSDDEVISIVIGFTW